MSFDKIKVTREAERFLSQGKIRPAINEYRQIVENDPKDFSTLNILGDLYAKNSEKKQAVDCFTKVAEHYNKQGFAHKAIAVYNKIARIEPNSAEVSSKLAELYYQKGSLAEARLHYKALAEQYQQKGKKAEALDTWKRIAELDPHNTEIYLKIAESCAQENQRDEAASAFIEAGLRLSDKAQHEEAIDAFQKALELKKNDLRALNGLVKAQIGFGNADEAAQTLENILKEQPYNREILYLLVDCYLDMDNPARAEQAVIKLVEQEPANYPKFLDLVKVYLKKHDLESASRVLSMSSEHLLVGGQADEFLKWTNEILTRNPEQLNALRLLVRFYGWQRDEDELKQALERLAEAARLSDADEDERYALSQLVMIVPHEISYAKRLQEINTAHGFGATEIEAKEYENGNGSSKNAPVESFTGFESDNGANGRAAKNSESFSEFAFVNESDFLSYEPETAKANGFSHDEKEFGIISENPQANEQGTQDYGEFSFTNQPTENSDGQLKLSEHLKLQKEIESVEFYISQGYKELAGKALNELEAEYGKRKEFEALRLLTNESGETINGENETSGDKILDKPAGQASASNEFSILKDLASEFDIEENSSAEEGDYDTHYQMAIAYKEMGLMEDAIREFQDAVNLIKVNDGTRRFFQCANLLGHCFMEKEMPNLALMWYKRCLEVADLNDEEKRAIYYEMGIAYEMGGDGEKAVGYYEKLYAENVDYRDVSIRLQCLRENLINA